MGLTGCCDDAGMYAHNVTVGPPELVQVVCLLWICPNVHFLPGGSGNRKSGRECKRGSYALVGACDGVCY